MTFQTDDWLIVPPGARNKRSVKDDPSLGTIDADGLVYGCEDAEYIAFDDELLIYEDVVELIKDRKKCKILIEIIVPWAFSNPHHFKSPYINIFRL